MFVEASLPFFLEHAQSFFLKHELSFFLKPALSFFSDALLDICFGSKSLSTQFFWNVIPMKGMFSNVGFMQENGNNV